MPQQGSWAWVTEFFSNLLLTKTIQGRKDPSISVKRWRFTSPEKLRERCKLGKSRTRRGALVLLENSTPTQHRLANKAVW